MFFLVDQWFRYWWNYQFIIFLWFECLPLNEYQPHKENINLTDCIEYRTVFVYLVTDIFTLVISCIFLNFLFHIFHVVHHGFWLTWDWVTWTCLQLVDIPRLIIPNFYLNLIYFHTILKFFGQTLLKMLLCTWCACDIKITYI